MTEPHTETPHDHHQASMLWMFIGAILVIYGVIIFITGLVHWINHEPFTTALAYLQPDIAWGVVLFIAGAIFLIFNWRHWKAWKQSQKNEQLKG